MKVSALLLSPWKRGGSLPMAFTFAATTTGCAAAAPATGSPPGGPPPPGGPGGSPPVPPPHSPIATLRSSSSSFSVSGYCGAIAVADAIWVAIWVVVWVVVILVPTMLCDRSLFVTAKNGFCVIGVVGASGSFMIAGLFRMVISRGSCSVSDSLCCVRVWTLTS